MENKKYKLVGILNDLNLVPDMVYPIFMDSEGKLYWAFTVVTRQDKIIDFNYKVFYALPDRFIEKVQLLSNLTVTKENVKDEYSLGAEAISCVQTSDNEVYIGSKEKYLEFLKKYQEYLKANGNEGYFLDCIQGEIKYIEAVITNDEKYDWLDIDEQSSKNKTR